MNRINKYENVSKLPPEAMNVWDYAASKGLTKQALYNQIRRKKNIAYKIVVFKGFNFVIPN